MKKFLTVLLVIAVMFTFSFSSAFAMTTVTNTTEPDYQIGDFYFAGPAVHSGTQGGQGVTDYELADVAYKLGVVAKALAKDGKYTYFTDNATNDYGPTKTTRFEYFHGSHLKNVQDLVASTLETVKGAKTSYAVNYALQVLDAKVFAEDSRENLESALKTETAGISSDITLGSLATGIDGAGTYLLPGYKEFSSNDTTTVVLHSDASKASRAYNDVLGWFFDNGFETAKQISDKKALQAFEDAVVKVSGTAGKTIYSNSALTSDALVLYHQANALKNAITVANVTDMDAVYTVVKAYRAFEAANVEDAAYTTAPTDDSVLAAALAYYGAVNFDKKYDAIKKMSQKEVLAAKADVVALAEAIIAFEAKYDDVIDIYGATKTYDLTRELGYIEAAGDDALVDAKIMLNVALPENLKAADKTAFEAYVAAYDAYKAEYSNDIYEDVNVDIDAATEAYILAGKANFDATAKEDVKDAAKVQAALNNATVKVTTQALGKGKIRVQAKIDVDSFANLTANGNTIEYKFYKKTAKATAYKGYSDKAVNYTTFKGLKKGTKYNFKCAVTVKDSKGNVVATRSYLGSTTGTRTAK